MFLIGLTGGIGTGKSTVSNILLKSKIPIIDSDKIARQIYEPNSKCWKLIRKHFGQDAINLEDNQVNREFLSSVIFSDPEKRKLLNRITHPEIQKRALFQLLYYYLTFRTFVVFDIPLLFESSVFKPYMSYVIVVRSTPEQQIERIKLRNGYTEEEAHKRVSAQISIEEKCRLADIVIDNRGSLDSTVTQINTIFENIPFPSIFWISRSILIVLYVASFVGATKVCKLLYGLL